MPSLTRLSARSTVTVRRGRSRARTPTAVASVGASAAPRTHAGPHSRPSPCAVGGDRGGGGEDQRGAGQNHDPQVVADLPQRGRQALPVQQCGQEQRGAPPPAAAGPAASAARTRPAPRPARAGWPARSGSGARARRTRPTRPRARQPSRVQARTYPVDPHTDRPPRPRQTPAPARTSVSAHVGTGIARALVRRPEPGSGAELRQFPVPARRGRAWRHSWCELESSSVPVAV